MLRQNRVVVNHENLYVSNEIENRRLEQLLSQLENFNLQATLVIGFALSTMNADNLVAIADDTSKFCIYKQPGASILYGVTTCLA
eukprot:7298963-Prymnesium_polylepis.1